MKILQGIFVFDAKFLLSRDSVNHSSEGENEIIKIICNKNVCLVQYILVSFMSLYSSLLILLE